MISVADSTRTRAHDAYHRFVRGGTWSVFGLWQALAVHAVARFAPTGVVPLDCENTLFHRDDTLFNWDDTPFHRDGPKVNGAGVFRGAVRSTADTSSTSLA